MYGEKCGHISYVEILTRDMRIRRERDIGIHIYIYIHRCTQGNFLQIVADCHPGGPCSHVGAWYILAP